MRPFRDYLVWQRSHAFALQVYQATSEYPRHELFGLISQTRRAATSIPTNIAEGSARSVPEFRQFLRIALGSSAELEYHLLLARDLNYLDSAAYLGLDAELAEIKRMLVAFIKNIRPDERNVR